MKFPWLDSLLLLIILAGAVSVWRSGNQRAELQHEYERLQVITGELLPEDPTQIYVQAMPTDDPLDFAWRVYFPPNYRLMVRDRSGSGATGSNSAAVNSIARVRLREIDGSTRIYQRFPNSSGLHNFDQELGEFLRGRWDRVLIEQLGKDETALLDPTEGFVILSMKLPDDLEKEADAKFGGTRRGLYIPSIFEIRIGPPNDKF